MSTSVPPSPLDRIWDRGRVSFSARVHRLRTKTWHVGQEHPDGRPHGHLRHPAQPLAVRRPEGHHCCDRREERRRVAQQVRSDPVGDAGGDRRLAEATDGLVHLALEQRAAARARKDYAAADAIRDQLGALGVQVEDTPQGTRWELT